MLKQIEAGSLSIAYDESGDASGWPVVLLHGFPYDILAYENVSPLLVARGARVIVPYLRGYGPTRFLSDSTLRSGEQAVLGNDLRLLLDALKLEKAILGGFDWGGRAACIVAALWPERCAGLVTANGYSIQNIAKSLEPSAPEREYAHWYQYYFHNERGRAGLTQNRREICRLLWTLWSPEWRFGAETFERSALAFDNPDFVEVVIHSYRHRYGLVIGDASVAGIEQALAAQPVIAVPAIVLEGEADTVDPALGADGHRRHFLGHFAHRLLPHIGHNIPQEAPEPFAEAIVALHAQC
ncbi:alpha/beta fold hydrolase [Bosea vaviloviae]|uniref:Alpha/beta hydrolase n=1 Tax=Bosea vaviloviae TaxID=1526658 RepID=A0A1D7U1T5_9HYPH|nr:alpha/beta hydrolase [Bosea vaviloviae]AOO81331.1 alpha/beta hydrolase [Bosea vaviloviae]